MPADGIVAVRGERKPRYVFADEDSSRYKLA
jgi:hypothetical protein